MPQSITDTIKEFLGFRKKETVMLDKLKLINAAGWSEPVRDSKHGFSKIHFGFLTLKRKDHTSPFCMKDINEVADFTADEHWSTDKNLVTCEDCKRMNA